MVKNMAKSVLKNKQRGFNIFDWKMLLSFGWSAIFITIGTLYKIILSLTLIARKMKTKYV